MIKVDFHNKKPSDVEMAYVVIVSKYEGKWVYVRHNFDIEGIVLQPDETCDARWSSKEEIRQMIADGDFIPFSYIEKLFKMQN